MLDQRRRRWSNIYPALGQRIVSAVIFTLFNPSTANHDLNRFQSLLSSG